MLGDNEVLQSIQIYLRILFIRIVKFSLVQCSFKTLSWGEGALACTLAGGGERGNYPPYNLLKYFSKLNQTSQFGSISGGEQLIYEFLIFDS